MFQPNKHRQTPLHTAASRGNAEVVRALMSEGADIMAQDENGRTPLHLAAGNRYPRTVQALLHWEHRIPLHLAAEQDLASAVQALLKWDSGPTIGYSTNWDESFRKKSEREQMVEEKDNRGQTALHLAAKVRGNEDVLWLLLAAGAGLWSTNVHAQVALHLPAQGSQAQNFDWVEAKFELAMAKEAITTVTSMLAAGLGTMKIYRRLISWETKVRWNTEDSPKLSQLSNLLLRLKELLRSRKDLDWNTDEGQKVFERAVNNHLQTVAQAALSSGVDKNRLSQLLDQIVTSPHGSTNESMVEFVQWLSAAGAEVDAKRDGKTTLYRVLEGTISTSYIVDAIRVLQAMGADPNAEYRGQTALHVAVSSSRSISDIVKIVRVLLEAGANVDTSYDGKTAINVAQELNRSRVVEVLEEYKADFKETPTKVLTHRQQTSSIQP